MAESPELKARAGGIRGLRWWIGGLLFASTVINYIDRQTLSVLAPQLKLSYRWSNQDFALIVIAFRIAYMLGQAVLGRMLDRLGTRRGDQFLGAAPAIVVLGVAAEAREIAGERLQIEADGGGGEQARDGQAEPTDDEATIHAQNWK